MVSPDTLTKMGGSTLQQHPDGMCKWGPAEKNYKYVPPHEKVSNFLMGGGHLSRRYPPMKKLMKLLYWGAIRGVPPHEKVNETLVWGGTPIQG